MVTKNASTTIKNIRSKFERQIEIQKSKSYICLLLSFYDMSFLFLNVHLEVGPEFFGGFRHIPCEHSHFFRVFETFRIDFEMVAW